MFRESCHCLFLPRDCWAFFTFLSMNQVNVSWFRACFLYFWTLTAWSEWLGLSRVIVRDWFSMASYRLILGAQWLPGSRATFLGEIWKLIRGSFTVNCNWLKFVPIFAFAVSRCFALLWLGCHSVDTHPISVKFVRLISRDRNALVVSAQALFSRDETFMVA